MFPLLFFLVWWIDYQGRDCSSFKELKRISIFKLDLGGVFVIEDWFAFAFRLVYNKLALSIGGDVCKEGSGAFGVVFSDAKSYLVD